MAVDVSRSLPDRPDMVHVGKLLLFDTIGRYYSQKKEPLLRHAPDIHLGIAEQLGKCNGSTLKEMIIGGQLFWQYILFPKYAKILALNGK